MAQTKPIPGTAAYYDKHIYPRLSETIGLGLNDTPSTAIAWAAKLGIVPTDAPWTMLEIGCGAGRNLKALSTAFPRARFYGFDGSPAAVRMAKQGLPQVTLSLGDIYGVWPFQMQFDVVFDITSGIPESPTKRALDSYVLNLREAVKAGGYAVIEAITPNDLSSKRFGQGKVVHWVSGRDKKAERLMSQTEARALYEKHGFEVIASHKEKFEAEAFGATVQREFIQLVVRKRK